MRACSTPSTTTGFTRLAAALNAGALPPDYYAPPEQSIKGPVPDVLTLRLPPGGGQPSCATAGFAVATAPPRARVVRRAEEQIYAWKADHVAVLPPSRPDRRRDRDRLAGQQGEAACITNVRREGCDLYRRRGPSAGDRPLRPAARSQGIHKAIWDEFIEEEFELPGDRPLTVVAYDADRRRSRTSSRWESATCCRRCRSSSSRASMCRLRWRNRTVGRNDFFPAPLKGLLEAPNADRRED